MSNNYVNYQVELIPDNAELINQINVLVMGGADATQTTASDDTGKETSTDAISATDVKNAARKVKKNHGEEFAMGVLEDADIETGSSLGRSLKTIPEDQYADIIAAWEAGPKASTKDDDDDDDDFGDDDDDDDAEVTAESVKLALKAYAKSDGRAEAKAIMNKHGAKALSDVDDCTSKQLAAMMKDLV